MALNDDGDKNATSHLSVPGRLLREEGVQLRRLPHEIQTATFRNMTKGEKEEYARLEEHVWEGSISLGEDDTTSIRYRKAPTLFVGMANVCAEGCYDNKLTECTIGARAEASRKKKEKEEKEAATEEESEEETSEGETEEETSEGETSEETSERETEEKTSEGEAEEEKKEDVEDYDPETSACSICYQMREGPCKEFFIKALPKILKQEADSKEYKLFLTCASGYPYYDTSQIGQSAAAIHRGELFDFLKTEQESKTEADQAQQQ